MFRKRAYIVSGPDPIWRSRRVKTGGSGLDALWKNVFITNAVWKEIAGLIGEESVQVVAVLDNCVTIDQLGYNRTDLSVHRPVRQCAQKEDRDARIASGTLLPQVVMREEYSTWIRAR